MTLDELTRLEADVKARVETDAAFREGWSAAIRILGARGELLEWEPIFPLLLEPRRDEGGRWVGVLRCPFSGRSVALAPAEAVILALVAERRGQVVTAAMLASLKEGDAAKRRHGLAVPTWMKSPMPFKHEGSVRKYVRRLRQTLAEAGWRGLVASSRGQAGGYRVTRNVYVARVEDQ
jgi:hypothetical protein